MKLKVILQQDVRNLGKKGDVVEVAEGYGRNFLLPRGLAVTATDANLRARAHENRVEQLKQRREEAEAQTAARKLAGSKLTLHVKAGEGGKLFGSVTAGDIAEALARSAGVRVDKRKVDLAEPIKTLGTHTVTVRLPAGVTAAVQVEVAPDKKAAKE